MEYKQLTFKDKQKTCLVRRKELAKNATKSELIFKEKLDNLKISYIFQKGFIKGDQYCIVDFYIPGKYKLCIELDGAYHTTEKQRIRDYYRDKYLTKDRKFNLLRLTNEEAESIKEEDLKLIIETFNKKRKKI